MNVVDPVSKIYTSCEVAQAVMSSLIWSRPIFHVSRLELRAGEQKILSVEASSSAADVNRT